MSREQRRQIISRTIRDNIAVIALLFLSYAIDRAAGNPNPVVTAGVGILATGLLWTMAAVAIRRNNS